MIFNLSDNWYYCLTDDPNYVLLDFDHSAWPVMHIPQNWFLAGLDYHGVVWFRYRFDHQLPSRTYATLRFDGVDYFAEVYLNGEALGRHEGYFEPFQFDVTQVLRSGKNMLAVRVDSPFEKVNAYDGWHMHKRLIKGVLNHHDCRPGGGWEASGQAYNTGGIWNRVILRHHGAITIDRVLLQAELEVNPPSLKLNILINNRGLKQSKHLSIQCQPDNFESDTPYQKSTVVTLEQGNNDFDLSLPVPDVKLWQPWDRGQPNLYRVSISLSSDSDPLLYQSIFGFRSIEVDRKFHWKINDQNYFIRGSNYISSQWLSETIFPDVAQSSPHPFSGLVVKETDPSLQKSWFERDIKLIKQANLNTIRVHAHVLPEEFYTTCDRAGILVWQDFPLQWGYSDDPDFHIEAERQARAMLNLLFNHPSIIAWCTHNESPWNAPWMAEEAGGTYNPNHNFLLDMNLETAMKNIDPTRYVHRNSGTRDGHVYPGWYYGTWHDYGKVKKPPGAPFPTEYGAQGLPNRASLIKIFAQFGPDGGYSELVRFKNWLDSIISHPDYRKIPAEEDTPEWLCAARKVWVTWRFHNFQPKETLQDQRISLGNSLDEFITNSQEYQNLIIQYATEIYRRNKFKSINGLFQFMFVDPWPAITWSVLDYWRIPKPSFDTLQRVMQPVLPCVNLWDQAIPKGRLDLTFIAVNDLTKAFPATKCIWSLKLFEGDQLDSNEFYLNIPANSVSRPIRIKGPKLISGNYCLILNLISRDGNCIGENRYDFSI